MNSRRKGIRFEQDVVRLAKEKGLEARRIPLSGATWMKGDVEIEGLTFELKNRKQISKIFWEWMKDYPLIVKTLRNPPLVVMKLDDFLELLRRCKRERDP